MRRKKRIRAPQFVYPREMWTDIGRAFEGDQLDRIAKQQEPNGSRLKVNAPSTRARKRKKGRPQLSLVDADHRLVQGSGRSYRILRFMPRGAGIVMGPANAEVREIMKHVLRMGYNFWGVSDQLRDAITARVRQHVREILRGRR